MDKDVISVDELRRLGQKTSHSTRKKSFRISRMTGENQEKEQGKYVTSGTEGEKAKGSIADT